MFIDYKIGRQSMLAGSAEGGWERYGNNRNVNGKKL